MEMLRFMSLIFKYCTSDPSGEIMADAPHLPTACSFAGYESVSCVYIPVYGNYISNWVP